MQTATQSRSCIIGKDMLDACLYHPLEQLDLPIPPKFERVASGGLELDAVDVLLREVQDTSYILEFPSLVVGAKSFSISFSFLRNGISEPGWLLSCSRPNTFFMFYAPETEDGSAFHALMVSRLKIMQVLDGLGYDRASLGLRDPLIRKANQTGIYKTVSPNIWFKFNAEKESKPISMGFNVSLLSRIATAEFRARESGLDGHWVHQKI